MLQFNKLRYDYEMLYFDTLYIMKLLFYRN